MGVIGDGEPAMGDETLHPLPIAHSSSLGNAPRVLFYVQHLLGIGHLARASRIAAALTGHGFAVTLVSGGMPVPGFPEPGVERIQLPALRAADGDFTRLVDAAGHPADAACLEARCAALLAALERIDPQVLIVETFPFGRRPLRFELLALLEAARARTPRPLVACSVRDIVQERSKPGRAEETVATLNRCFDGVLVHGDPRLCRLGASFALADAIEVPIAYTGLVAGPRAEPALERFEVVVSAGGGAVGEVLLRAALAARAAGALADARWCLLTGPNLADARLRALAARAPGGVEVQRFRADFADLLAGAELSLSQAGYNTVADVLRAGCRALLVPYAEGGETEQPRRAALLAGRGLATVLEPRTLDGPALAAAIAAAMAAPKPPPGGGLDLAGAAGTARILRQWLERRGFQRRPISMKRV